MSMQRVGRYKIVEEIGRGGMATVYRAFDPNFQRHVAVKVMAQVFAAGGDLGRRFQREAQTIARLEHRAILPVYDFGEYDGLAYIVMRLLEGGNLTDRLTRQKSLSLEETVSILRTIADALDFAHSNGVIHRDIKPSNIGFDSEGIPLIMDFGIAKLINDSNRMTRTGGIIGTPSYMSPEQVTGLRELDGRSDVYSLGVVAFEMLTGRLPYEADSDMGFIYAHVNNRVPPISEFRPDAPKGLDAIFFKVLAKKPADRYGTAAAFWGDLARLPEGNWRRPPTEYLEPRVLTSETGQWDYPAQRRSILDVIREAWQDIASRRRKSKEERSKSSSLAVEEKPRPKEEYESIEPAESIVPSSIVGTTRPSILLLPQVHDLLAPAKKKSIRALMAQQEPERIVNYVTTYGSGRFLVTGYGSFGGTSLAGEICQQIEQDFEGASAGSTGKTLVVQLLNKGNERNGRLLVDVKLGYDLNESDPIIDTFVIGEGDGNKDIKPIGELLDALESMFNGGKRKSSLQRKIYDAIGANISVGRLILTLDKLQSAKSLTFLLDHPLSRSERTTLLVIIERETYNRWPGIERKRLRRRSKFQIWAIPCLWEADYQLVDKTMGMLFDYFQMESREAANTLALFKKHIAYLGRGLIGNTLYELRQIKYWEIDKETRQAFMAFDHLDSELIEHHAWIQDLLEENWNSILEANFAGQDRTDRAKQGVYSLMDWIIDASTFTLQEVLEEAEKRPVLIHSRENLRNLTTVRLLDVLVKNNYLKRVENEYDVVWGRDVTSEVLQEINRERHAEQAQKSKDASSYIMVAGDLVGGDKIDAGDIVDSAGAAIGRDARADVRLDGDEEE